MQLLGGQAPPRKYDYLTVYDPQENVFTCRLLTPKKMYLLVGLLIFLSSCRLLHVHVFLGRLAVKKTLLEGQPPRKLYFPCNPNLAVHAWRCTAKKHFLGGFPIFLGGFWPPRKFRSVVVLAYVVDCYGELHPLHGATPVGSKPLASPTPSGLLGAYLEVLAL